MKKLLLTTLGLATGFGAFAQLPVSQTPENKHVILEEFTGLYCTFCPDGHAVGNTIAAANPNTFHRIHIHTGGFATPGANDPDMRTPEGDAIVAPTSLTGYPAGSINRTVFSGMGQSTGGIAQSRGNWSATSTTTFGQASYVNVAVVGNVNITTRQLTVDVEVFYTGTAPTTTQYLSVALLQSNILGHQTDGGNYNPSGWKCQPEDLYKHAHVLRKLVNTGNTAGDVVMTNTGAVVSKQYVLTLPADIAGVDLELGDLELVAFVTEGTALNTPVVSGNDGPVNLNLASGVTIADMSSTDNHVLPAGLCDNQFIPKMDITNNSATSITGVDVSYIINGTPTTVNLPTQTIAAGATYTHTFATTTLASGGNTVEYNVALTDASKYDGEIWNNKSCPATIYVIPATAFGTNASESFESMSISDDTPANTIFENTNGGLDYVVDNSVSSSAVDPLGGFGNSAKSFRWRFYNNAAGVSSAIIYEKLDLSTMTGYAISFDHAYAQYSNENDKFEVWASTDCGGTWTSLWMKQGAQLSTTAATTSVYYAGSSDWVTNVISLSAYETETELMLKFQGTSAFGNNLYVDNINISNTVGIEEEAIKNSISIYPNPTTDFSTVSFNLTQSAIVKMEVFNTMGSLVFSKNQKMMNSGTQKIIFDGTELPNGIYFVNLIIGDQLITKKVSLLK